MSKEPLCVVFPPNPLSLPPFGSQLYLVSLASRFEASYHSVLHHLIGKRPKMYVVLNLPPAVRQPVGLKDKEQYNRKPKDEVLHI